MTNNDMEKIGAYIKECRVKKGLSQRTLAKQIGVSRNTLDRYEKGKSVPDIETVQKIEQSLGISLLRELSGYPEQTEIEQDMQNFAHTVSITMTPEEQETVRESIKVFTRYIDRKK